MFVCPLPTFKMTKSIVCPAALIPPSEIRCPHKHAMMPVVIRLGKYLSSAITSYLTLKSRRFRSSANEALSEHFYHPRNSAAVRRGTGGSVPGANEMQIFRERDSALLPLPRNSLCRLNESARAQGCSERIRPRALLFGAPLRCGAGSGGTNAKGRRARAGPPARIT